MTADRQGDRPSALPPFEWSREPVRLFDDFFSISASPRWSSGLSSREILFSLSLDSRSRSLSRSLSFRLSDGDCTTDCGLADCNNHDSFTFFPAVGTFDLPAWPCRLCSGSGWSPWAATWRWWVRIRSEFCLLSYG
jgi:hypothetical protein